MDLYGCHFEYAGDFSRKYGLYIANVDTERNVSITGKSKSISAYNKRNQLKHDLGNVYTDAPLTFDMEVVSDYLIQGELRRKIQKWLFNQKGFQKLYIDRADEICDEVFDFERGVPRRTYLNCKFVNPEKIEGNGGIVGFRFTVECDSHLAWQDPIRKKFSFPGGVESSNQVEIVVDTDMDDFTYPRITIRTGASGGSVYIINKTDDSERSTSLSDLSANTQYVLNGTYNFVSDDLYEHFIDRNFPRLLDGKNAILVSGDVVALEVEWQNKRYL